ncbi:lantibiotic dehydratase [Frankia sp. Cr1]|uniref:lantibiotic dehydratase n=1 Tax=Frankia sp. Cr1 TaxID=3073931 RepID=UPI002AD53746|nr:lantibiotic dehydratase [Frankia sp. Cr1]
MTSTDRPPPAAYDTLIVRPVVRSTVRERYGPGVLIPVRELVAESGLGYPDGYSGVSARPAWRTLTERDATLLSLIQAATFSGTREIRLTEVDIQALTIGDHVDLVPPTRIELGVTLHAQSLADIDRGDFELRVTAAPRIPTSMAGRFAHLLTSEERDLLAATYVAGERREGSVTVQMSFPPRLPRNENVVRVPPLIRDVLSLGEHPCGPGTIGVDDLAVTADAAQMYLVQRSTGRRVIPRIPHALDLTVRTPPLARFIAEIADARSAGFGPFDPGAARTLPYLPRIRYRRTVLAAARWLLSRHDLPTAVAGDAWKDRLEAWRRQWRVPARVIVCNGELRLPLDLAHPLDLGLLRAQLERAGRLEVREDGPADGDGWLGRPAELLIPLLLASPPPRPLPVTAAPGRVLRPGAATLVCGQFEGSPERFDDVLSLHLPRLAVRLGGLVERWWVRRYRDMSRPWTPQHLAVYLRLIDREAFARVASELAAFAAELDALGLPAQLSLTSSYEQPGRYGHGDALSAAEQVFAADTAAAVAQIAMAATAGVPGQAVAAASLAQLAAAFAPDPTTGYRALTRCLEQTSGPSDRAAHDLACQLVDSAGDFTALRAIPGGDAVATAWARRDAALAAYREILSAQRDPGTVLRTLLHEHHMRALGLDPELEEQTGRLARAAALRRLAVAGQP